MTAVIKPIRWSTDDYHQIISTGILKGRKAELINGEIVVRTEGVILPLAFPDIEISVRNLIN
ncbi:MAG: hypothetical protein N5P05_001880 [Chroococcopsis gigantea SAG 12.99]|jgi:hypothetical protein|nr:hypothetical protein [Chlorogloea purpurea SAG 13.99]MDV3000274.1 hypothetical protein [Chroococcopsis gigantea SAG 12.99]